MLFYFRCQRCYTKFEDEKDLFCHENSLPACTPASSLPCDGIDNNQAKRIHDSISAKTNKGKSDEDRWFDIWTILFPGIEQPQSPYSELPRIDSTSFLTDVEFNAELHYELGWLNRDDHNHGAWIDIIKQALDTAPRYCRGMEEETAWPNIPVLDNTASSELGTFLPKDGNKTKAIMEGQYVATSLDHLKPDALPAGEFDEFVHSDLFMDLPDAGLQVHGFNSPLNLCLPSASDTKSSTTGDLSRHLRMRASPISTENASFHASDSTATISQVNELSNSLYINEGKLLFDDVLNSSIDSEPRSRDHHSQHLRLEPDSFFKACQRDCNEALLTSEEEFGRGIDAFINAHDFERLLTFEMNHPNANGPINHIRDMNKGLKGRYEYDGSM
ncbi:hypothetical protein EG329_011190 [Mollisiaceae sp. DMI_Dod_QoI]|nr:hypothetical protein EG329_011190 [Helotiales sp. DMI_Dod_QoI]